MPNQMNERTVSERDLAGNPPPRSEVHATYIKLTWQNLFSLAAILIAGVVGYMKLTATDETLAARQKQTESVMERIISVQDRQQDWMTDIAIKMGVPTPPRKSPSGNP